MPAEIQNTNLSNYMINFKENCSSALFRTLAKERGFYLRDKGEFFFFALLVTGTKIEREGNTLLHSYQHKVSRSLTGNFVKNI